MNPHGTIRVRPDKTVEVCSWCEVEYDKHRGTQKGVTEYWLARQYEVTHGICGKHAAELKADLPLRTKHSKAHKRNQHSQAKHINEPFHKAPLSEVEESEDRREEFIHESESWLARNSDQEKRQV